MHFSTALLAIACLLGTQLLATASPYPQKMHESMPRENAPDRKADGISPVNKAITDDTIKQSIRLVRIYKLCIVALRIILTGHTQHVKSGCISVSSPVYHNWGAVSICAHTSIVHSKSDKGLGLVLFKSGQKTVLWGCFTNNKNIKIASPGCQLEYEFPAVGTGGADYDLIDQCLYYKNQLVSQGMFQLNYLPTLDHPAFVTDLFSSVSLDKTKSCLTKQEAPPLFNPYAGLESATAPP